MSSVYWPLPVMNRWSSLRLTDAPMPVSAMALLLEMARVGSRGWRADDYGESYSAAWRRVPMLAAPVRTAATMLW